LVAEAFVESELLGVAHQLLGALGHLRSAVVGGAADRGDGQAAVRHGPRGSLHHVRGALLHVRLLLHSHLLHTRLLHSGLLHALLLHARVGDVDVHRRVLRLLHGALPVHRGAHHLLPDRLARVHRLLHHAPAAPQSRHALHCAATQLQAARFKTSLPLNCRIRLEKKSEKHQTS
jgi:hypothetical protein